VKICNYIQIRVKVCMYGGWPYVMAEASEGKQRVNGMMDDVAQGH